MGWIDAALHFHITARTCGGRFAHRGTFRLTRNDLGAPTKWDRTFLALIIAQTLHSLEEYTHRLYDVFPPARAVSALFSSDLSRGFIIFNTALVLFGVWCFVFPVRRRWRSAELIAWVWVALESINGVGHLAWALAAATYRPGAATALLLLPLALFLAWQLATRPAAPLTT